MYNVVNYGNIETVILLQLPVVGKKYGKKYYFWLATKQVGKQAKLSHSQIHNVGKHQRILHQQARKATDL
jgi:hypothetical protein